MSFVYKWFVDGAHDFVVVITSSIISGRPAPVITAKLSDEIKTNNAKHCACSFDFASGDVIPYMRILVKHQAFKFFGFFGKLL